ncbi:MAG: hypothetical protein DMF56_22080 [Acidobacteria bacterium]|nr:MAG: hypothetical protein DMF56_22080 [Acidobacteriota bacterium]
MRVPFVRLSGRWLEAFGFKEGAKFAAVGVEGGLLVLTVYAPAPEDRASTRDASHSRVRRAQLFTPRSVPCKPVTPDTAAPVAPGLRARF